MMNSLIEACLKFSISLNIACPKEYQPNKALISLIKKKNGKIFLDKSIKIIHKGASSVDNIDEEELEKNRNWHWMWSTFYYHKKHKGFILALILVFPKLLSATIKVLIFFLIFNKKHFV